jgi:hypothetical protein
MIDLTLRDVVTELETMYGEAATETGDDRRREALKRAILITRCELALQETASTDSKVSIVINNAKALDALIKWIGSNIKGRIKFGADDFNYCDFDEGLQTSSYIVSAMQENKKSDNWERILSKVYTFMIENPDERAAMIGKFAS